MSDSNRLLTLGQKYIVELDGDQSLILVVCTGFGQNERHHAVGFFEILSPLPERYTAFQSHTLSVSPRFVGDLLETAQGDSLAVNVVFLTKLPESGIVGATDFESAGRAIMSKIPSRAWALRRQTRQSFDLPTPSWAQGNDLELH